MRTQLPLALCFVMGVLMLGQYFVPHAASQDLFRRTQDWLLAIGVFALVLGLGSLVHLHWERIRRRSADWRYSVVVLTGLVVMAGVGLVQGNLQPARKLTRTAPLVQEDGTYTLKDTTITLRAQALAGHIPPHVLFLVARRSPGARYSVAIVCAYPSPTAREWRGRSRTT